MADINTELNDLELIQIAGGTGNVTYVLKCEKCGKTFSNPVFHDIESAKNYLKAYDKMQFCDHCNQTTHFGVKIIK